MAIIMAPRKRAGGPVSASGETPSQDASPVTSTMSPTTAMASPAMLKTQTKPVFNWPGSTPAAGRTNGRPEDPQSYLSRRTARLEIRT